MSRIDMNFGSKTGNKDFKSYFKNRKQLILGVLVAVLSLALVFTVTPAKAAQGGTITISPVVPPAFLFEPEDVPGSLKEVPQWNELEQLLDNPYNVTLCPDTPGNGQGYPSYCSMITRRPAFGVTLPPLLVHPLNYNPTTGEEMRLINVNYPGGSFDTNVSPDGVNFITVSPGVGRVQPGEAAIDYDSPFAADNFTCITLEGQFLCGGDPGEPNYGGFGVLVPDGYSVPGVPGGTNTSIAGLQLFDPERGYITARDPVTGAGGLRKPSLRVPEAGGSPAQPNYLINTDPNNVTPSNENDYVRDRAAAMVLGKALFWDMQVGSDGVQACASCHFKAGADDRTKNQLNPNHLGGDLTMQLHGPNADQEVVASDFPLHKLANPDIAGDPACTTPMVATLPQPPVSTGGTVTVCDAGNIVSDVNDVMSSMGVVFSPFTDIPIPGASAFVNNPANTVNPVLPDIRTPGALDPIPVFQGLRRVEPRNTPIFFGTVINFDNFWDGRARHDFNGGSVFGASDPQSHVMVNDGTSAGGLTLTATRQIIRFSSLGSLATGPALSNFEMSFDGRNWAKIGKKLLQAGVTPLANQLVEPTDSVLGPYSNQGGSQCAVLGRTTAVGTPGLCVSYNELIQMAFYPQLWANTNDHLDGASVPTTLQPPDGDPFDGFSLTIATGQAVAANTSQFTQMEANMALFFGLGVQLWGSILMPDDTPFDQFMEQNPDAFLALGEAGEPLIVKGIPLCTQNGNVRPCITEFGNFKRDVSLGGTRQPSDPDPLLGMDIFEGSNVSGKNRDFRSARCGTCHLGPELTDNNIIRTHASQLLDFVPEFIDPGVEMALEPLGRPRVISGFLLESELNENGQDAIERFIVNQSIVVNPVDGLAYPDGAALIDNGVYNIGVRPSSEDIGRGGSDPFGKPLSIATLMLNNLGGVPGTPLPNFDPGISPIGGGVFAENAHDQQINPGFEAEPVNPQLPPYLAPWVNLDPVGNAHPELDEVTAGLNTLTETPIIEGFIDILGPFNPAGILNEALNNATGPLMGTYPTVNRVIKDGAFKAPPLRNVELTGPYFHNGGKLTLRQVVDFYSRGGDFPITNGPHRDMMILNLKTEVQSNITEEEAVALVDFLLELTDDRVRFERAPFDRPEMFVPLDGAAPDNTFGRQGLAANSTDVAGPNAPFRHVPAVGAAGDASPLQNFLNISSTRVPGPNNDQFDREFSVPLTVFVRGTDNAVWTQNWNGSEWSGWLSLGGVVTSNISATSSGSTITIFARGSDNALWTQNWNGTEWSGWQPLGGVIAGDPDSVSLASETYVFVRGSDNAVWYRNGTAGAWNPYESLGGVVASDISATSSGSTINIFVRGTDNSLWTQNWNGGSWSGWQPLGGVIAGDPESVSAGLTYVLVRGSDNAVWYRNGTAGAWNPYESLGGVVASDISATSSGSTINIFVSGADNALWTQNWNGGSWNGWQPLGGIIDGDPDSVSSASETYVFVRGADNGVWYRNGTSGAWNPYESLGGVIAGNPESISG